jgi:hypothetical protein
MQLVRFGYASIEILFYYWFWDPFFWQWLFSLSNDGSLSPLESKGKYVVAHYFLDSDALSVVSDYKLPRHAGRMEFQMN